jgi:serine/threonine protein kinase
LVLDLALQLCNAVKHLHGVNVVHSDVKPANILFASAARRDHLKLGDFGVARFHNSGAAASSAVVRGLSKHLPPWYDPYVGVTFPKSGDAWAVARVLLDMMTLDCEPDPPGHGPDVVSIHQCIAAQYNEEVARVVMPLLYVGKHSTQQPAVDVIARTLKDLQRKLISTPVPSLSDHTDDTDNMLVSSSSSSSIASRVSNMSSSNFEAMRQHSGSSLPSSYPLLVHHGSGTTSALDTLSTPTLGPNRPSSLTSLSSTLSPSSFIGHMEGANLALTLSSPSPMNTNSISSGSGSVITSPSTSQLTTTSPSTTLSTPDLSRGNSLALDVSSSLSPHQSTIVTSGGRSPQPSTSTSSTGSGTSSTAVSSNSNDIRRWTARELRRQMHQFFHDNFPHEILDPVKVEALLNKFAMMTGAALASETFTDVARLIYDVLHDEDTSFMLGKSLSSWIHQLIPSLPSPYPHHHHHHHHPSHPGQAVLSMNMPSVSRQHSFPSLGGGGGSGSMGGLGMAAPLVATSSISSFVFVMTVRVPSLLHGEDQVIIEEVCNEQWDPLRFHSHQTRTEWHITFAAASAAPGEESASLAITARHAPGLVQWLNSTFEPVDPIHFEPPVTATPAGPCITVSSSEPTMIQAMEAFHHKRLLSIWGYQIVRIRRADYLHVSLRVRDARDVYHRLLERLRSPTPPQPTPSGCLLRSIEVPGGLPFIMHAIHSGQPSVPVVRPDTSPQLSSPPALPSLSSSSTSPSPFQRKPTPPTDTNLVGPATSASSSIDTVPSLSPSPSVQSDALSSSTLTDTPIPSLPPLLSSSLSTSLPTIMEATTPSSSLHVPIVSTEQQSVVMDAGSISTAPPIYLPPLSGDGGHTEYQVTPPTLDRHATSMAPTTLPPVVMRKLSRIAGSLQPRIGLDLQICIRGMHCRSLHDPTHIAAFLHFPAPTDLTHLTDPQSLSLPPSLPPSSSSIPATDISLSSSTEQASLLAPMSLAVQSSDIPSYIPSSTSSSSLAALPPSLSSSELAPLSLLSDALAVPSYVSYTSDASMTYALAPDLLPIPTYPSPDTNNATNGIPTYQIALPDQLPIPSYPIPTYPSPSDIIPTYAIEGAPIAPPLSPRTETRLMEAAERGDDIPTDALPSIPHYIHDNTTNNMSVPSLSGGMINDNVMGMAIPSITDNLAPLPTIADLLQSEQSAAASGSMDATGVPHHIPTQVKCTRSINVHCWCTLCQMSSIFTTLFPIDMASFLTDFIFDYLGPVGEIHSIICLLVLLH